LLIAGQEAAAANPLGRLLPLLSLTFKAASALIYKLILLNFVAQRVALLGLLVCLSFPLPAAAATHQQQQQQQQQQQLLQHTSNIGHICCNSCPS